MMVYGGITLNYVPGTLVLSPRKTHTDVHFDDTDLNDSVPLGRRSTLVSCKVITKTEQEYATTMQIVHSENSADLQIGNIYFKNVTTGEDSPAQEVKPGIWVFSVQFRCNNPIPYSVVNDEPLY